MRCTVCRQEYSLQRPRDWGTCPICTHRLTMTAQQARDAGITLGDQFAPTDTININAVHTITPNHTPLMTLVEQTRDDLYMRVLRQTGHSQDQIDEITGQLHALRGQRTPEIDWHEDELEPIQVLAHERLLEMAQNYTQIHRTPVQLDQAQQSAAMTQQIIDNSVWRDIQQAFLFGEKKKEEKDIKPRIYNHADRFDKLEL